jgi:hypothetical protein
VFCNKCNAQLKGKENFCSFCGNDVNRSTGFLVASNDFFTSDDYQKAISSVQVQNDKTEARGPKRNLVFGVLSIVLSLLSFFLAFAFLLGLSFGIYSISAAARDLKLHRKNAAIPLILGITGTALAVIYLVFLLITVRELITSH